MVWLNTCPPKPERILYAKDPATTWVGIKAAEAGLLNLTNTCFLNASVQALLHLPGIVEFLQNDTAHQSQCFSLECILCAFYRTYLNMSIHPIFKPRGLVNLLPQIHKNFKIGRQEDAHEFTTHFLDKIEEHLIERCGPIKLDFCSKQTTAVGKIFTLWLEKNDKCIDCEWTSTTYDPVTVLTVPLEPGSVQKALNNYLDEIEIICDFSCTPHCQQRKCSRTYSIHTYPKVLRILFNRFDNSGSGEKILSPVNIERSINVRTATYNFVSGIFHEGDYADSGHYTCVAMRSDGKLMHYDDAVVTEGNWFWYSSQALRGIYIAYYQLHHFKPVPLKRSPPKTPSKATSPFHKKQHVSPVKKSLEKKTKRKLFSPRKCKRRLEDFVRVILPKSRKCDNAQPLNAGTVTTDHAKMNSPINYSDSEATATAIVTPVKIKIQTMPGNDSEPSLAACSRRLFSPSTQDSDPEATVTAIITPVKIKIPLGTLSPSAPSDEDNSTKDLDSEATVTAIISPVKIKIPLKSPKESGTFGVACPRRGLVFSPSTLSPSAPSDEDNSTKDLDSEATVTAIISPVKIKMTLQNHKESGPSVVACRRRSLTPVNSAHNLSSTSEMDCPINYLESNVTLQDNDREIIDWNKKGGDTSPKEMDNTHPPETVPAHFFAIEIAEDDGKLPHPVIEKNTVPQLKKWLQLRGKPTKGKKQDLIKLVNDCMGDVGLNPKGGKLHNDKHEGILQSQDIAQLHDDEIFPTYGWCVFPSRDIPHNFNFGSVYNYLVETMPQLEDSDDASSGDEEEEELVELSDPFQDVECTAINHTKKLRRGLQYVKSAYVRNVQDTWPDKLHVYKAQVRASMLKQAYLVKVALSPLSGSIIRCSCDARCPQRTLGRCSHISALLLFILMHKNLNGPEAISCTSRPNTWNMGALKCHPSVAKGRQYESFKIDIKRRATFDPRLDQFQTGYPSIQQKNNFLTALAYKDKPCLFQTLLSYQYEDFDYDDEEIAIFRQKRVQLYEALQHQIEDLKPSPQHQGAFEVKGTKSQSSTQEWSKIRALHCSAQPSHQIAHFQSDSARMNFLRNHLWAINPITTMAMTFGEKNESAARRKYAEEQLDEDATAEVEESGLYLNTNFVGLSCSPDGIKTSAMHIHPKILLEIKCIYSLRGQDLFKFDEILTPKQLKSFCLERTSTGEIELKPNHAYYDQIQFSMGIMNLPECDFFVWTDQSTITVTVPFNENRWMELKQKLEAFHLKYLVPEYFAMRTPRELHPIRID